MNIDPERKAFEVALNAASKEECAIAFIREDTRASIAVNIVEALFEMWLAAKRHALLPQPTPKGQNDPTVYKQYRVTYLDLNGYLSYHRVYAKTPKLAMQRVEEINPKFVALGAKRPTGYIPVHLRKAK